MARNISYLPQSFRGDGEVAQQARKDFGDRLRVRMNQKGWNQSQLAEKVGVFRDSISTYINGKTFPDPKNLAKLAKVLGCPVEELIPTTTATTPASASMAEAQQDGDGMRLRINKWVSFEQAARIMSILSEDSKPAGSAANA